MEAFISCGWPGGTLFALFAVTGSGLGFGVPLIKVGRTRKGAPYCDMVAGLPRSS